MKYFFLWILFFLFVKVEEGCGEGFFFSPPGILSFGFRTVSFQEVEFHCGRETDPARTRGCFKA